MTDNKTENQIGSLPPQSDKERRTADEKLREMNNHRKDAERYLYPTQQTQKTTK